MTSDPETLHFEAWLARRPARVGILFASVWPGAAVRGGGGDKSPPAARPKPAARPGRWPSPSSTAAIRPPRA
ncbi:hypothetical protein HQ447_15505 [bacterium]|nr:hypothetical protein [bacterium]